MKKSELRQLIREELRRVVNESKWIVKFIGTSYDDKALNRELTVAAKGDPNTMARKTAQRALGSGDPHINRIEVWDMDERLLASKDV